MPAGSLAAAAPKTYSQRSCISGSEALFALVERRPHPPVPTVPAGILFGTAVWLVSYQGWVPALGIMAPPSRDRPGRPQAMLAAHLLYGAVLGVVVGLYPAACKWTYSTINKGR